MRGRLHLGAPFGSWLHRHHGAEPVPA
jgi:hypothetical protein